MNIIKHANQAERLNVKNKAVVCNNTDKIIKILYLKLCKSYFNINKKIKNKKINKYPPKILG